MHYVDVKKFLQRLQEHKWFLDLDPDEQQSYLNFMASDMAVILEGLEKKDADPDHGDM